MTALGRLAPPDFEHVAKYPLAELGAAAPTRVPVAPGVNWYTSFDTPVLKNGVYWVGLGNLGTIRGGHCFCLEPAPDPSRQGHEQDATTWWAFYNQGQQGSCEGHGHSRMQSLIYRERFDAVWLYHQAQQIDGINGPHEGTTNRAVLEVMRTQGMRVAHGPVTTALTKSDTVSTKHGITAYRWATTADEILAALGTPHLDYMTILNSWGQQYPERVRVPATVIDRLLREGGEAGVVTDR